MTITNVRPFPVAQAEARRLRRQASLRTLLWGLGLGILALIASYVVALADVQPDPKPVTWKRCSSTITVGGTAQSITGYSGPLRGFYLQNPSTATESLFFDPTGTAVTTAGTSGELTVGVSVSFGPGTIFAGSMSVIAATSAHAFICMYAQ